MEVRTEREHQREIYHRRICRSPVFMNRLCSPFVCSKCAVRARTYAQHVVRVRPVLWDFLKARFDKVSKVIRPETKMTR